MPGNWSPAGLPEGKTTHHGKLQGLPKQQPLRKHPHLPINIPSKNVGATMSPKVRKFILFTLQNKNAAIIPSITPPTIAMPAIPNTPWW